MQEIIRIENLYYTYPDGTKALDGINLTIYEGETVGIVGPNGAGKTTLLLHLNGILRGKGNIYIMGKQLNDKNIRFIRENVGIVFQDPDDQLFMPKVFDDVAFGPINLNLDEEDVRIRVKEALKDVGMLDLIDKITYNLSIGEKKRVAIATVLSMHPKIIVLDEPSSNLDCWAKENLIEVIKNLNNTKIIAGHDWSFLSQLCTRIIVLNKGRIIQEKIRGQVLTFDKNFAIFT